MSDILQRHYVPAHYEAGRGDADEAYAARVADLMEPGEAFYPYCGDAVAEAVCVARQCDLDTLASRLGACAYDAAGRVLAEILLRHFEALAEEAVTRGSTVCGT
jgi:hypothetical protein